jgi:hypothetical protein
MFRRDSSAEHLIFPTEAKNGQVDRCCTFAVATSAQAMPLAPLQTDGMTTQVRFGCGPGRTLLAGLCVARTSIRHSRRVTEASEDTKGKLVRPRPYASLESRPRTERRDAAGWPEVRIPLRREARIVEDSSKVA